MLTRENMLKGRDKQFPSDWNQQLSDNLDETIQKVNAFLVAVGLQDRKPSSGWRPPSVNASTKGAAPRSNHMLCMAADIEDADGAVWRACMANLALLKTLGLYLEDKRWCPTWTHFQTIRPASRKRIFLPHSGVPPKSPHFEGKYDTSYDG